ncbi:MAG: tetratricopeptide repeat protein [Chloroflexi bacterium]|nr:tetratricopeptide repeat protein [Chloroflexota bacterium]
MSGSEGSGKPAGRTPRAGGATATSSLYERYKDALRRGHVAALRGRNDAAVDAYGEAASIAPDRALPHASIGGILARMDRFDDAVAAYDRALVLAPADEGAMRGLADIHVRTGRRTDAAAVLDRLADSLDGTGRLADATDAARRALELAESRDRRAQVESLVGRLRATPSNDEAGQRALDQALRLLEPEKPDGAVEASAAEPETIGQREPAEPEPEAIVEPVGLGIALGATAEDALHRGDLVAAHEGLLASARAHRRAGRLVAAVDACYLAIGLAPADPELHLLLVELYLDRGWRSQAADKLLLLGRLADLDGDGAVRERLCAVVSERMADEPRVAELCA